MKANEIRKAFLTFFASKGHQIVPSAPIVIKNDPTLMFTNAGMNQFKDYFLGNKKPDNPRIADTQKCMRVSGKHNDLEDVGVDTYHHTMFEMLGNWSFGDYFKQDAIQWAWEFLTEVLQLPKHRLYTTVFEGNAAENVPFDQESFDIWQPLVGKDHILMGNKKDNFWEMGDTGPCGPCTEIHFDMRPDEERQQIDGSTLVNQDHPQVIEIWNNVFIQFNRTSNGSLELLPDKHVDTGMGFERLVRAVQGKTSNYDTDLFMPLLQNIEQITGLEYGSTERTDIAMRVVADHIRSIIFTIADGQMPSNNGAGYVVRRILRRAVRYAFSTLQYKKPLLCQLVPLVAEQFADIFPELQSQQQFIQRVIVEEENSFLRTLDEGLRKISHIENQLLAKNTTEIDGNTAFQLYDTYGFPLDLTRLIAREKNLSIDEQGFNAAMQQQKEMARAAAKTDTGDWNILQTDVDTEFVGYDLLDCYAEVVKWRQVVQKNKTLYHLVLSKTPFYAESGGQIGDTGTLCFGNDDKDTIRIFDTKKENDLIVHYTEKLPNNIAQPFYAKVDENRRQGISANHSATHLLHAAMREVLGTHVHQKGSLVAPDHLRFDFAHFAKPSDDELRQIEQRVNQKIMENIALQELRSLPIDEAKQMGAMALFGEKYGDKVRVIIFDKNYSIELCGGTHVAATGNIGFCKIKTETAIAAGVRRIEAYTGASAYTAAKDESEELKQLKQLLDNPKDATKALQDKLEQMAAMRKELEKMQSERAGQIKNHLKTQTQTIGNIQFLTAIVDVANADMVKKIAFDLRREVPQLFAVLAANIDGKAHLTVMLDDNLVSTGLDATKIIRQIATHVQGGGGGQPYYATAGGKNPDGLNNALRAARQFVEA